MFFGYFLNIKKVTPSADFVIGPAKAEAFLFSHTRLPFPPRPLLPFGRISPAAKPGWPVTGPAFWVCRAKSRAAFRCAKPPCAVVRFAAMTSSPRTNVLAYPAFASLKRGPSANNPALVAIRLHFACGETALAGHRPHLLGLPRKIGRGVSPRETTRCGLSASRPWLRHPAPLFCRPVTAAPRRVPNGKTPALAPHRLHFARGETARPLFPHFCPARL